MKSRCGLALMLMFTIAATALTAGTGTAADYPISTITIVVPTTAGGGYDLGARNVARFLPKYTTMLPAAQAEGEVPGLAGRELVMAGAHDFLSPGGHTRNIPDDQVDIQVPYDADRSAGVVRFHGFIKSKKYLEQKK